MNIDGTFFKREEDTPRFVGKIQFAPLGSNPAAADNHVTVEGRGKSHPPAPALTYRRFWAFAVLTVGRIRTPVAGRVKCVCAHREIRRRENE